MSQVVSQQYTITGRLASSTVRASVSSLLSGRWIAPGRWSSSYSGLGSTSTSCAPAATSLRTSSRRISFGIMSSCWGCPYSRALMMLSIGGLGLHITIVTQGQLRADDDNPASITMGGGGQAANFCAWAANLGEPAPLATRVRDDDGGQLLVAGLETLGDDAHAIWTTHPTGSIAG